MGEAGDIRYKAFLSYSHNDSVIARRVHSRLEGFHIDRDLVGRITSRGSVPGSLRPIFRDRGDFDAGGSLGEQTAAALDASAALIVLCSPHAAKSRFVNEETRAFEARHPDRPVVPLIVSGAPGPESFPRALRFVVIASGELTNVACDRLAADLREDGDGFDLAIAKVVARLLGLPPDDIYRRAERERRRQQRIRTVVAALVAALAVLGGWFAWSSYEKAGTIGQRTAALDNIKNIVVRSDNAGDNLRKQGDVQGARQSYESVHEQFVEITKSDPANLKWQHDLAVSSQKIGDTLTLQSDFDGALKAYGDALAIVQRLERSDPNNVRTEDDLSLLYQRIGDIRNTRGDLAGAAAAYEHDVAITGRLAQLEPGIADRQHDLASSHRILAAVYMRQRNMAGARREAEAARTILAPLVAASPDRAEWKDELARIDDALEVLRK